MILRFSLGFFLLLEASLQAHSLSIKEAEEAALAHDHKIQSLDQEKLAFEAEKNATRAGLLPTLHVEYSTAHNYPPASPPPVTQNVEVQVRADVKNPISIYTEQAGWELEKQTARLSQEEQKHNVLYNIRLAYFKGALYQQQLIAHNKNLDLRNQEKMVLQKKGQSGRLIPLELDRVQLECTKEQQRIEVIEISLQGQQKIIQLQMGRSEIHSPLPEFSTPLPRTFVLPGTTSTLATVAQQKIEVEQQKKKNLNTQEQAKWVPDLYAAYQKGRVEGDLNTHAFLLGFSWTGGVAPYYKQKAASLQAKAQEDLLLQEIQETERKRISLLSKLQELLAQLHSQKSIVAGSEKIAKESQRQHMGGSLPLQNYLEDVRNWTSQENRELDLRHEMVEKLAELAWLENKPELFYLGIGG